MKKTKRRASGRALSAKEMSEIRRRLETMTDLEKASGLLNVAGCFTRLKLLYLIEHEDDLPVAELADRLEVSVPAVCQHLAKLRAHGLVAPRREAQIVRYRLTDHPFNQTLRANFF
jgi:DNA-binding transcriptional ArsR family regulator